MEIDLDKLIAKHIYKGIDDAINELYMQEKSYKYDCSKEKEYIKEKALEHIEIVMNAYFDK